MGISIHPPRAGRDQVGAFANRENAEFQSTRPVRGGTFGPKAPAKKPKKFQSTRPVRGGTAIFRSKAVRRCHFNPPAPCGAGQSNAAIIAISKDFNPPAPCGAGRVPPAELYSCPVNFNPPAPCGAGLQDRVNELLNSKISIHPPRAGRDYRCTTTSATYLAFQSTRPVRGGTLSLPRLLHRRGISIHPPRAGRDAGGIRFIAAGIDFNPPAPCGAGRPIWTAF